MFFGTMMILRGSGGPRFTSGSHFLLRGSSVPKLARILDQGAPRFFGGPEVNFQSQWIDKVERIQVKPAE